MATPMAITSRALPINAPRPKPMKKPPVAAMGSTLVAFTFLDFLDMVFSDVCLCNLWSGGCVNLPNVENHSGGSGGGRKALTAQYGGLIDMVDYFHTLDNFADDSGLAR